MLVVPYVKEHITVTLLYIKSNKLKYLDLTMQTSHICEWLVGCLREMETLSSEVTLSKLFLVSLQKRGLLWSTLKV